MVTQYYYPENFRVNDICEALAKDGHEVQVLTGIPNYPEGRYYKGYGWFKPRREVHNGVKIRRAPLVPRGKSKLKLVINYLSFAFFGGFAAKALAKEGFDLVFAYEVSPITMILPAIKAKKKAGIPLISYITDLWPESVQAAGGTGNGFILRRIGKVVDKVYRESDHILVSSHSYIEAIAKRGVNREKIGYWPQYAEDFYAPVKVAAVDPVRTLLPQGFLLLFTGNLGMAQGLEVVLEAAERLRDMPEIKWVFVGNGRAKEGLQKKAKAMGLENSVFFLDAVPATDIPKLLALAEGGLLALKSDFLFDLILPGKVPSYLACGKPIIASVRGESAEAIEKSGAGLVCPPSDGAALAEIAEAFYRLPKADRLAMQNKARAYFLQNFEKRHLLDQLVDLMDFMIGGR